MGIQVKSDAINGSGQVPVEYKIIVKNDDIEEKTGGGIYIPEHLREKEQRMRSNVTIVAIGGNAFEDWKDPIPQVGDRVRIARYAGEFIRPDESLDKRAYQIITDKDIITIIREDQPVSYSDSDQPDYGGDGIYSHLRADNAKE